MKENTIVIVILVLISIFLIWVNIKADRDTITREVTVKHTNTKIIDSRMKCTVTDTKNINYKFKDESVCEILNPNKTYVFKIRWGNVINVNEKI